MPTTKFTTLANLDRYTTHVEEKNVQVTRAEYTNLPSSKLTDNRSYFIEDEGIVIKNGVEYGEDTIYTLGVGSGADANKITLTPSEGSVQSVTVPYATSAGNANTVSNHTVAKDVPADAKFTDTTYSNATTVVAGLMSTTDKSKLDGIAEGATANTGTVTSVGLTAGDGISVSGGPVTTSGSITVTNKGVRSVAQGTTNGTINVNTNGSTADVAVKGLGSLAYKSSLSKSDVGLGNVANLDQSKAIKSITRSGTTFTATAIDGTTSSFTQQDNNTTYSDATTATSGLMSASDKVKLNGVASGAEVNQNAFSNVKVGDTTVAADAKTDTLELVAGTNVTLTPDATNDKVTIAAKDTTYSANNGVGLSGTTFYNSGVRSIATGGTNGTINVNTNGSTANVAVKGLGSAAYTASTAYIASSLKGANNGVAELDSAGKVPSSQLPSFVDDVLEYDSMSGFPSTGEAGKIYVAKDTNKTYRWSGTAYVEISPSLALGETSSTAYRGDRGKTAYDHSQATGNPHGTTKANVGLGNVANLDQSKAIKSITRSGTTFTATALDGTTSSFTQQDNNTTYTGSNGITLTGTNFTNSGVRSIATGTTNGTINVNTNGSTADVPVKGLGSAAYTASTAYAASSHTHKYAGSSSAGGAATSANKINTDAGTALNPVYFSSGIPVASGGNTIPFVAGTGSTAGTWLGSCDAITAYTDGLLILYKPSVAGASTTTLNINSLGAKTVYLNNTSKLTTHYPANQPILLVYSASQNSGCWMAVDNYDSNSDTKARQTLSTTNDNYPLLMSYANNATTTSNVDNVTYRNNSIYANPSTGNIQATSLNSVAIGSSPKFTDTTYSNVSTSAAGLAPKVTDTSKYLKGDGTQSVPTNTTYSNVSTSSAGLAPKVTSTSAFLKGDGTWATPTNTTYSNVSTSAAGLAPKITDTSKFLKGDGTWATPTNTTYSNVSSASAGLAPKGAAVSSQSQSTKFLREDGSWAKPSYTTNTNTTYTFANGTNGFTVTPSGGSAQTVTVTPSIANNVTGSGTSGYIAKFNGGNTITNGPAIGSDTTKYLRNDGTWVKPPNDNTWTAMVGATSAANGSVGYVNAVPPKDGYNTKYLRADGTWTVPPNDNTTYSDATTATHGLMSTSDKTKLNGIATGAEVNQNAFSNVVVGSTTVAADSKTDTLTLAGSNVTLTPDATNDKVTIGITKANVTSALGYTPPTTNTTYTGANGVSLSGTTFSNSGVRSIATGGSNGTINVNTNGSTANVAVKGLGSAAYTASTAYATSGHNHDSTYLKLSGGTLTGALNLANGTQNNIGDDCKLGDCDQAGCIGIQGMNGNTGIIFKPYQGSTSNIISADGNGGINVTGQLQNEGKPVQRAQSTGPQYCTSNGNGGYCKIATVQITSAWQDYEFAFTITQRNRGLTHLFVSFHATESTDPPLNEFKADNNSGAFYIKKTATSTQEIYMSFSQAQASCTVHEVIGCGEILNTSNITMNMTQVSSIASDAQQAQGATYEVDELQSSSQHNLKIYSGGETRSVDFYTISSEIAHAAPLFAKSYNQLSSRKMKENITPLSDSEAKKILDVEVVNFDYKKEYGGEKNCKGVIAEDVNEIIPYVTEMNENNDDPSAFPGVDYSKFIPYLIKIVQVQQKEINDLKERIEILENK